MYTPEQALEEALKEICSSNLSIRAASKKYNISFGTLRNKYHGKHGARPVFSKEEEAILDGVLKCGDPNGLKNVHKKFLGQVMTG